MGPSRQLAEFLTSARFEDITIEDIRGREHEFAYTKNGFCILPLDCGMEAEEFGYDNKISEIYIRKVGESVKKALGAARVQVYDYTVSPLCQT